MKQEDNNYCSEEFAPYSLRLNLPRKHFSSLPNNVTVVGPRGEVLAVGTEEVIGINRALALSATAARRAGNLLDSLASSSGGAATLIQTLDHQ